MWTLGGLAGSCAAPLDLPAWCRLTGHAYLGPACGCDPPAFGLRVVRGAAHDPDRGPWHPTP